MTIDLAFWATYGLETEPAQRVDVEHQAREWAASEPRITACRIVKAERPDPERPMRWTVTVDVDFEEAADNLSLWDVA
jgi:hypothetical protein